MASDVDLKSRAGYRTGMALHRSGDTNAAREHLLTAAETGRYPAAQKALGDIAFDAENWDEAIAHLGEYLETEDLDTEAEADATMRLALSHARRADHERAAALLAKLLDEHPDSSHAEHARFELGQSLLLLGKPDEAEPILAGVARNEGSRFAPHAMRWLASIESDRGNAGRAAQLLGRATQAGLEGGGTVELAAALIASGSPEEAVRALEDQHDPASRAWRVIALASAGKHASASKAFHRADLDQVDPSLARSARYHAAQASRKVGDHSAAEELYREVLTGNGDLQTRQYARVELGILLTDSRGRIEEAESLLTDALNSEGLPPDLCAAAVYRLAGLASDQQDHRRVIDLLDPENRPCELGDLEPSAELLLGIAFAESQRPGPAADRFEIAVRGFEDSPQLAGTLLRLGEAQAAAQRWQASEDTLRR
ncbi:MAG: tetratricopeptide repeat protein, partial [Planctomycetota bacterium]